MTVDDLESLKKGRDLLRTAYCPFWFNHPDGKRHCMAGAINAVGGRTFQLSDYLDPIARKLHPELAGAVSVRTENPPDCPEYFNSYPAVYVNNFVGKDAILRVMNAGIAQLEQELVKGESKR